jgi:hypothetical protein
MDPATLKTQATDGPPFDAASGYAPFALEPSQSSDLPGSSPGSSKADGCGATHTPLIVSFGGGNNSRALLIGMVERETRPDLILFADTGGELPETYENTHIFSAWLVSQGFPEIVWVQKTYQGKPTTLESDCLRQNTLPSIAFGFKACSQKYKRDPQDKYRNNWQPAKEAWAAGQKCVCLIGYHAGEPWRANLAEDAKYFYAFPLISWGWDRWKCIEVVLEHGFKPGKSACFFCPSNKKSEILGLQLTHPELLDRALAMESNARLETVAGLGRRFAWKDFLAADQAQMKLFPENTERMPCDCFE